MFVAVAERHSKELPNGTVSLSLMCGIKPIVEAYDVAGKPIGTIPNDTTSSAFRSDLEGAFAREKFPDVITIIVANTMKVRGM